MNDDRDSVAGYRWITIILAILLIWVGYLWIKSRSDLEIADDEFRNNVSNYRDELRAACTFTSTSTSASYRTCENVLAQYADVLAQYKTALGRATSTSSGTGTTQTIPTTTQATTTQGATSSP